MRTGVPNARRSCACWGRERGICFSAPPRETPATPIVPPAHRALECADARRDRGVNSTPGKKPEAAKPEPAKKPAFEQSLARLEEIVRKLESPNLPLDEAMKLFEEGMQLSRDCQKQLEQAEARVEILLKKAGGEMAAQPFEPESEEET
jgi:exodeoxyribonuclease VII small subunit